MLLLNMMSQCKGTQVILLMCTLRRSRNNCRSVRVAMCKTTFKLMRNRQIVTALQPKLGTIVLVEDTIFY